MQYTIDEEYVSGGGLIKRQYVVRSYERVSEHTGSLLGLKTLKEVSTKKQAYAYLRRIKANLKDVIER